jgi:hypothetical protein
VRGAGVAISAEVSEANIMEIEDSSSQEQQPAAIVKKAYERPGFRYEQVFVVSALSCGKISHLDNNCQTLVAS